MARGALICVVGQQDRLPQGFSQSLSSSRDAIFIANAGISASIGATNEHSRTTTFWFAKGVSAATRFFLSMLSHQYRGARCIICPLATVNSSSAILCNRREERN